MDQSYPQRSRHTSPTVGPVNDKRRILSDDEDEYDNTFSTRSPNSTRRYHNDARTETGRTRADVQSMSIARGPQGPGRKSAVPPRSTATQTNVPVVRTGGRRTTDPVAIEEISPRHSRSLAIRPRRGFNWSRFHWSVYVGLAMLVMLVCWIFVSSISSWWQMTQDDLHYGRPRTFQTDYIVGHNDSITPSHFIALNLQRHIEIIEMPSGDASKSKIYIGPILIGQNQDLAVVTLSFKDVNGDGKPDMIVSVQDSRFVFINTNGSFRPARPGEKVLL